MFFLSFQSYLDTIYISGSNKSVKNQTDRKFLLILVMKIETIIIHVKRGCKKEVNNMFIARGIWKQLVTYNVSVYSKKLLVYGT